MVVEVGRRKPVLKKELKDTALNDKPDSACKPPTWQRQPARVSFEPNGTEKTTYSIRRHSVDIVSDADEHEESE
jgi:hypothetical protein